MTGPFTALPPEIIRMWLETGPGTGPMRAASRAWMLLSDKYFTSARELRTAAERARNQVWRSQGGEAYAARCEVCAQELLRFGTRCIAVADALYQAATAHDAALGNAPTLIEIAENRATQLMAEVTNFFGVNTPLIAWCESQYMAMWIRAAIAMDIYDSTATAAMVSVSGTAAPAPTQLVSGLAVAVPLLLGPTSLGATSTGVGPEVGVPTSVPLGISRYWSALQGSSVEAAATEKPLQKPRVLLVAESRGEVPQRDATGAVQPAAARPSRAAPVLAGSAGAGSMGFAGTAAKATAAQPGGLTTLADDGSPVPMLPATWDPYGTGTVR